MKPAEKKTGAGPSDRDVVDQPRFADAAPRPGAGSVRLFGDATRRQRLGVARFQIIERESGLRDRGAAFVEHAPRPARRPSICRRSR